MFKFSPASLLTPALSVGLLSTSIGLASNPAVTPLAPSETLGREGTVIVHDALVRIAEGPVEVSETAAQPAVSGPETNHDQDSELAQRFVHALTTPAVAQTVKSPRSKTTTTQTSKVWTCGQWQTLWQGRGQGRTCEFK